MKTLRSPYCLSRTLFVLAACLHMLAGSSICHAAQIYWAQWTDKVIGDPSGGSALGTLTGLGVTASYTGEVDGPRSDGALPSWSPTSTYSGGFVGNAPLASYGSICLTGGSGVMDTITFSKAVVNPVMAIWSLGNAGTTTSFNFQTTQPITIEAGGPSAEYGGGSIFGSGSTISGTEGNGTIEFHGTFSQISFTTTLEATEGYNFTIGAASVVPEPAVPCLMLLGLVIWGLFRSRQAIVREQ